MLKKTLLIVIAALLAAPAILRAQVRESVSAVGVAHINIGGEYSRVSPDYWGAGIHINAATGYLEYNLQGARFGGGLTGEYKALLDPGNDHRRETTMLFGPKMVYRVRRFYPFVKLSGGVGQFTQNGIPGQAGDHLVLAPAAGLDYRLSPRIDIRAFDYEYQFWRFGTGGLTPSVVSFGMSYRIR